MSSTTEEICQKDVKLGEEQLVVDDSKLYADEIYLLQKEIEKLRLEKERLENENKNLVSSHDEKLSVLTEELENKYKHEMSDLRIYFENSYSVFLQHLNDPGQKVTNNSVAVNEADKENVNNFSNSKANIGVRNEIEESAGEIVSMDESKIQMKESLNKDLQNFATLYRDMENRKNDEIQRVKRSMETKYLTVIETLQNEMQNLLYAEALENKVKQVHSVVMNDCQNEVDTLQDICDRKFEKQTRSVLENQLEGKFQEDIYKLNNAWKKHFEEILSDILVNSTAKKVTNELSYESKLSSLKLTNNHSQNTISTYGKEIRKLEDENSLLLSRIDELQHRNEMYANELTNVKSDFMRTLNAVSVPEMEPEKIVKELEKMKKLRETEMRKAEEQNVSLQRRIKDLEQQQKRDEVEIRQNIVFNLFKEIKDLTNKEQSGELITWPVELASLEQLFLRRFQRKRLDSEEYSKESVRSETESIDRLSTNSYTDLNEILKERDGLKKVNEALHGVVKVFTKYLTNCEEELNNTLIGELVRLEPCDAENDRTIGELELSFSNKDKVKKVHFAPPDISEILNILNEDQQQTTNQDHSISIIETELNACLERLRNEASAVLCLTTGNKKLDETRNVNEAIVQTDLDGEQVENDRIKVIDLEKNVTKAEEEISELTQELKRLTEKINALESIEGYGEGFDSLLANNSYVGFRFNGEGGLNHDEDEDCSRCDKLMEEAKKEIEDRDAQLKVAHNKLKNMNKFLERQTAEREHERAEFDVKIENLQKQVKDQTKDYVKLETDFAHVQHQMKKLATDLEESELCKEVMENKLKELNARVRTLTDIKVELETKLSEDRDAKRRIESKLKETEEENRRLTENYEMLMQQLMQYPEGNEKQFEELNEQHVVSSAMVEQIRNEIFEVERTVISRTRELENTYLPLVSNTVLSSPSEDVSVCDRFGECLRVVSPSGSDQSSSPIHVPINHLACLHDKITKLIRAEEAVFKKIKDQDIQLGQQTRTISELECERDTLLEKLNNTVSKLSEVKNELNNWQHGHTSVQSEIQLELSRTIESLETEKEHLKKCVSFKDDKIAELSTSLDCLNNYIATLETDYKESRRKTDSIVQTLQAELDKSSATANSSGGSETRRSSKLYDLLLNERNDEIKKLKETVSELRSMMDESATSKVDDSECKKSTKTVSFAENLESFADSDVSREAAAIEMPAVPHYVSYISYEQKPLINADGDDSSLSPLKIDKVFVDRCSITCHKEELDRLNSALSSQPSVISNVKSSNDETRDGNVDIPQLSDMSSVSEEKSTSTDEDTSFKILNDALLTAKEDLNRRERRITELTEDLATKEREIERLENKIVALECEMTEERNQFEARLRKSESSNKTAIKGRMETQVKLDEANARLKVERTASEELRNKIVRIEAEKLIEINDKTTAAKPKEDETDAPSANSSLRNLTEQVQKEIEKAEQLDKNILKSLESDSRGTSFVEDLLKISHNVSESLKRILIKTLQQGPQELTTEEREILAECCGVRNTEMAIRLRQYEEIEKTLQARLDTQQTLNHELTENTDKMQTELNRLEMVLNYYDDRMSFLVTKLDEYLSKAVKLEIELTSEKGSRKQYEILVDRYKKEVTETQRSCNKKIDEILEQLNATVCENLKLKQEIESLNTKIDTLTAELNSFRVISQYHSDSESDLSRSLNPLKLRIAELQERFSKIKLEYEKKRTELQTVKATLNVERANNEKLENLYKCALDEKAQLERIKVDLNVKLEDVNWHKQKLEEKLHAAELAEMKRRKIKASREEANKKEHEAVVVQQRLLEKECGRLKREIMKIGEDYRLLHNDWKLVCEEAQLIFVRMMLAEKNQRMLAFQKQFFKEQLRKYKEEMITVTENVIDAPERSNDYIYYSFNCNSDTFKPIRKFRSLVFGLIAIRRIRFMIERRNDNNRAKVIRHFKNNLPGVRIHPYCKIPTPEFESRLLAKNRDALVKKLCKTKQEFEKREKNDMENLQELCDEFSTLHDKYVLNYGVVDKPL